MLSDLEQNPWPALADQPPFVLPCDESHIVSFNSRARAEHYLHLGIVPEPYLGDPKAPVILLNLNPGFSETDVATHLKPAFYAAARANLLHSHQSYPFYLLNSKLPSPGRDWWFRKLRPLIERVGLPAVASSVFVAEVHGYHSRRYGRQSKPFPSQQYTRRLVREAVERNALIVIMRAGRLWRSLVPELTKHPSLGYLHSVQSASISPRNCPEFFEEIVGAIQKAG